jgi:Aldo/keto reductase family
VRSTFHCSARWGCSPWRSRTRTPPSGGDHHRRALSGKFTGPQGSEPGTRIDPASITAQQRAVARAVQSAADDLGATASQVAIAWTRARSPAIHPIIGALRLAQLQDNLGAAQLGLPPEIVARLDAAAGIDLGFPATFIQDNTPWVFGAAALPAGG